MNTQQTDAILDLMEIMVSSYPSQGGQDSAAAIRGYMMAIDGCSFRAIDQVMRNVITGKQAGFNNRFAPTPGEIGEWCREADRQFREIERVSKPREHGHLRVNFGGRDIDTSEMSLAEVEELFATNGRGYERHQELGSAARSAIRHIAVGDSEGNTDAGEAA